MGWHHLKLNPNFIQSSSYGDYSSVALRGCMHQILHVIVIGFHHKKGCQVDFAFPPLDGEEGIDLPSQWYSLPSLAMPDGAHNTDSDIIYFNLPSREKDEKTIFGISCYRQMSAGDLLSKTDDITRSTVQKSVCVLSRVPLYGVLKAKLQLITQAYFNERDFAKVDVLSQMYTNLCDMFEGDLVDGQAASMDISVKSLFTKFRHRALLLFKLCLLEKRVVFDIFPVQELGDTMIALLSLFPKLLEEGLFYSSRAQSDDSLTQIKELASELDAEVADSRFVEDDVFRNDHDSYGFPLSIFTQGNVFHPYTSISFLDIIRSPSTRAFTIGATNALFVTKRELLDAIVTIDSCGAGQVEFTNLELKKILTLTAADLRFGDFLLKTIEENSASTAIFEGGDEWIRLQIRGYLLALAATARSDLQSAVADYGSSFVAEWKKTRNFRIWMGGNYDDLVGCVPGHSFAGQIGIHDVFLRVEHVAAGSEGARKALTALSSTGKNIGESSLKMKQSLSSWFRGETTQNVEGVNGSPVENKSQKWGLSGWLKNASSSDSKSANQPEPTNVSSDNDNNLHCHQNSSQSVKEDSKVDRFSSWLRGKKSSVEEAVEAESGSTIQ